MAKKQTNYEEDDIAALFPKVRGEIVLDNYLDVRKYPEYLIEEVGTYFEDGKRKIVYKIITKD